MTLPRASTPVRSERVVPVRLPTPSAHEPNRTVLRWRATDLAATALFVGCALLLFRISLFEDWTFIGDPDRLNSVLNTRLFETDAVRARGTVPTWSDQQFMGYSIVSIHWMLTGFTPVPYLLALLPRAAMVDGLAAVGQPPN